MTKKLLCIVGSTATGKTALALDLAARFQGELLSADSRQVYKGLDVGTGKDIPEGFLYQDQHYTDGRTHIWGYDVVGPDQEFSSAHFVAYAKKTITGIEKSHHLPIVVGGTGLYVKQLLSPPETLSIPPNPTLRAQLETLSRQQLQQQLQKVAPSRWNHMNQSDQANPRRLIRAIEVAKAQPRPQVDRKPLAHKVLMIGLTASPELINARIKVRVRQRLRQGMLAECRRLAALNLPKTAPVYNTLGYQQMFAYLEGNANKLEAIDRWMLAERQYARRQLTWFKKQPKVHWFSVSEKDWKNHVVSLVEAWYSGANDQS